MPGRKAGGVMLRTKASTPRFIQTPGSAACMAATMDDLPARGAPLSSTMAPGGRSAKSGGMGFGRKVAQR